MRRILLSVGVSAGASLRERKSPSDFPNQTVSRPRAADTKNAPREVSRRRFLVCPPGLEPGPKASEAFMVSNSTTGTISFFYFTLFCFLFASDYAIIIPNFRKNFLRKQNLSYFSQKNDTRQKEF